MNEKESFALFLPAYLRDLRKVVDMDSGSYDADDVSALADVFAGWLVAMGGEVTSSRPVADLGPLIAGRFTGSGRGRVLLIGHLDTVYPHGEARRHPFRIEGERGKGPGAGDMKSGCLLGLYAVKALLKKDAPFGKITLALTPDEEIGSPASWKALGPLAAEHDATLVLEPGRLDGSVVVGRKGVGDFTVRAEGHPAHAGVAPQAGRSAIVELARQIVHLTEEAPHHPGLTFNVGTMKGGSRPNVVPEHAEMVIDVRAETAFAADEARHLFASLRPLTDGVKISVEGDFGSPPMETTPAIRALYALVEEAGRKVGVAVKEASTGGGSDANRIAAAGRPVLCGMGPVAGGAHSEEEYVLVPSVTERGALLVEVLERIGRDGFDPKPRRG